MTHDEALQVIREALEAIAKRPDLPNPNRYADWKNCQLWSQRDARKALAALDVLANNEWQPIETAPYNRSVLIEGGIGHKDANGVWYTEMCMPHREIEWKPTHWMPLPAPPKEIGRE